MEDTNKKAVSNEEYTVGELIGRLMMDDSWEPDPEKRKAAVISFIRKMQG